jgi:hypothetical protein
VEREFRGFDRPPYLASFWLRGTRLSVQLLNVHLFYGSESPEDIERRALEIHPAPVRAAGPPRYQVGDPATHSVRAGLRMPKDRRDGGNIFYDALTSRGLVLPEHSTQIGSSTASDNRYDRSLF